jgi:hypothetical protein
MIVSGRTENYNNPKSASDFSGLGSGREQFQRTGEDALVPPKNFRYWANWTLRKPNRLLKKAEGSAFRVGRARLPAVPILMTMI